MKIHEIKNPNYKWWNPLSWHKVVEVKLENEALTFVGNGGLELGIGILSMNNVKLNFRRAKKKVRFYSLPLHHRRKK